MLVSKKEYFFPIFLSFILITAPLSASSQSEEFNIELEVHSVIVNECSNAPCEIFFEIPLDLEKDKKFPSDVEDYIEIVEGQNTTVNENIEIIESLSSLTIIVVENNPGGNDIDIGNFTTSTSTEIDHEVRGTVENEAFISFSLRRVPAEGTNLFSILVTIAVLLLVVGIPIYFIRKDSTTL